jgi:hypothetical protein
MAGNIPLVKGATEQVLLQLYETDSQAGPVRDLTDATVTVVDVPQSMPIPTVEILSPATDGKVTLSWSKEQTARLRTGNASYSTRIAFDYPGGDRDVIMFYYDVS